MAIQLAYDSKSKKRLASCKKRWHTFTVADGKDDRKPVKFFEKLAHDSRQKEKLELTTHHLYNKANECQAVFCKSKQDTCKALPAAILNKSFNIFPGGYHQRQTSKAQHKLPKSTISYDSLPTTHIVSMGRSQTSTSIKNMTLELVNVLLGKTTHQHDGKVISVGSKTPPSQGKHLIFSKSHILPLSPPALPTKKKSDQKRKTDHCYKGTVPINQTTSTFPDLKALLGRYREAYGGRQPSHYSHISPHENHASGNGENDRWEEIDILNSFFPSLLLPPDPRDHPKAYSPWRDRHCDRDHLVTSTFKRTQSVPALYHLDRPKGANMSTMEAQVPARLNQTIATDHESPTTATMVTFRVSRHLSSIASLKSTQHLISDITNKFEPSSLMPKDFAEKSPPINYRAKVSLCAEASESSGCSLDTFDTLDDCPTTRVKIPSTLDFSLHPARVNSGGFNVVRERKDSGVGASLAGMLSNGPPTSDGISHYGMNFYPDLVDENRACCYNEEHKAQPHCYAPTNFFSLKYLSIQRLASLSLSYYFSNSSPCATSKRSTTPQFSAWDQASDLMPCRLLLNHYIPHPIPLLNSPCVLFNHDLKDVYAFYGAGLPTPITRAMDYLTINCRDTVGLFRKAGLKSRVLSLKSKLIQSTIDGVPFCEYSRFQPYDVADLIKLFFRELPQPLFPKQISFILNQIINELPLDLHLTAMQCALLLLPDENRAALQLLLDFCHEISLSHAVNQMTASNIAVCLCPTLFYIGAAACENGQDSTLSSTSTTRINANHKTSPSPYLGHDDGTLETDWHTLNKTLIRSLTIMIENCKSILLIPHSIIGVLKELNQCVKNGPLQQIQPLSRYQDTQILLSRHIKLIFQYLSGPSEFCNVISCNGIRVDHTILQSNSHPRCESGDLVKLPNGLSLWKVTLKVPGYPVALLRYLQAYRPIFFVEPVHGLTGSLDSLPPNAQIIKIYSPFMPKQHSNPATCLRSIHINTSCSTCISLCFSLNVPAPSTMPTPSDLTLLASDFIIRPCGSGISRLIYVCCVDFRGHSPEWLTTVFSRYLYNQMSLMKENFAAFDRITCHETSLV